MMKLSYALVAALLLGLVVALMPLEGDEFVKVPKIRSQYVRDLKKGYIGTTDDELVFLKTQLPNVDLILTDRYTTRHNEVTHTYYRQTLNGLEVFNGVVGIHVNKRGEVLAMSESVYMGPKDVRGHSVKPRVSPLDAIVFFAKHANLKFDAETVILKESSGNSFVFAGGDLSLDDISVHLRYVQNEDGELVLAWEILVHTDYHWYNALIGARDLSVEAVHDWTHWATYNAYPIGVNDPDDGARTLMTDPHLVSTGSPLGWHDQGDNGGSYTVTIGNNVDAHDNIEPVNPNKHRPESSTLYFDYPIDFTDHPNEYLDASLTNLFYWNNIMHDIFYEYGFDEVSGNFQTNNFGLGGKENDEVDANGQDGRGMNNAMFSTPPDGQPGTMAMFLWTGNPVRDGSLEAGIIIHEYAHGITNRLSGGPSNSNCMSGGQAGGMGEGWGDCWSLMLRWRDEYTPNVYDKIFEMGEYAAGEGIRQYPYAWNFTDNPQTYESINSLSGVHAYGCVWCSIIYNVFQLMVDRYGFSEDHYHAQAGNNILLQDMVDGLKLQPCNPNFVETRDAILLADKENYFGAYNCDYWEAFARRGLGINAVSGTRVTDSFDVPPECSGRK